MAMEPNPDAYAIGFSLYESTDSHRIILPGHCNSDRRELDVTMLAANLSVTIIPADRTGMD
ncbi:hypothetical protein CSPAE12_01635 [Colletotrichum incanum]|nr:hypothetical protein CSPAE12_01635 [Colletotrichum incanum]